MLNRGILHNLVCVIALFPGSGLTVSIACAKQVASGAGPDTAAIDRALSGIHNGQSVEQVAVSPDGKRLAWVEPVSGGSEVRVAPMGDLAKSERVTAAKGEAECQENQITWSPDGSQLAFFSDCMKPGAQTDLYVASLDGKPLRRLTDLRGYEEAPAFSPDGRQVAFLYVEGASRPAGALAAMKPPAGVMGTEQAEIERVAVAKVDAGEPEAPAIVSPENLHVYEFAWRPDSEGLAYVAAAPPGENNWWVAKLYTQALGGAAKAILAPAEVAGPLHGLQIAVPRWAPDGKAIAFIGGLMSDQGATGGDVWIVSAEGGTPRDLTPERASTPEWIEWGDDEHIYMTELDGGNAQLVRFRLQGDRTGEGVATSFALPLFSIPGSVGDGRMEMSLSSTPDRGVWVFAATTFDHPMEIYATKAGAVMTPGLEGVAQLSHFNDGLTREWGKSISLTWKSDEFRVQGWLMFPKDYDAAKKYPMLVDVHGGPAAAVVGRWSGGGLGAATFSALGYFVLEVNPRGSFGQGEKFVQANRKDFGYGDLRDILAGVDRVLAQYPVDAQRIGIMGWSYGGFMSMFAVTQTDRFKAAVAGAGISNWQSYYGENSIDQWMTPYFGASVYDDPAVYARSSAINFIKRVKTPTLELVGDRDGECPAPQSFEFWHALRAQNVPVELVVYPHEGHGFTDPGHRRDVVRRAAEWFARYMPAGH